MIDPQVLQELENILGKAASEVLVEVIDSYLENALKLIDAIHTAILCEDAMSLQQAAHTLKSSSAALGATYLSQICQELEVMGRAGTVAGGAEKVAQLEVEYEAVKLPYKQKSAAAGMRLVKIKKAEVTVAVLG